MPLSLNGIRTGLIFCSRSEFYPGKVGGGLFERGHVDSRRSSNIYDNVDSISRFQTADDYHTLGHYGCVFGVVVKVVVVVVVAPFVHIIL
jgi:hypothetical protein